MATKAELEAELAELRQQLAARPEPEADPDSEAGTGLFDGEKIDWEHEATELIGQFDELARKKPLLLALGAFSIGFMLGRSR